MAKIAGALEGPFLTIVLEGSGGTTWNWAPGFDDFPLKIMTLVSVICNSILVKTQINIIHHIYVS